MDKAITKEEAVLMVSKVKGKKVHSIELVFGAIMGCNLEKERAIQMIEGAQSVWISERLAYLDHPLKVVYLKVDHVDGTQVLTTEYLETI